MDINVTSFVNGSDAYDFSGSRAERGINAAQETWNNAMSEARAQPLLHTADQLQAMRDWAEATGAWDDEEIAAWSDQELNALFIQLVSGDMREAGMDDAFPDEFDWDAYEGAASEGQISGTMFQTADGSIYFTLDA